MHQEFSKKLINIINRSKQYTMNKSLKINKKASGINIVYYFKNLTRLYCGIDIILKKEDAHKMNGVIKNLKANGLNDKEIFLFIEYVINKWESLVLEYKEQVKDIFLTVTPSLPSFFIIKDYCFTKYKKEMEEEIV